MEYYGKLSTLMYDLDKPQVPQNELDFYLGYVRKTQKATLEVMCGSGRFLVPMLRMGYQVEGLDNSKDMLNACLEKCKKEGLTPVLYEQAAAQMELSKSYELILVPAASFGLITDRNEVLESLTKINEHLLPGGTLVFEVETPNSQPQRSGIWDGKWFTKMSDNELIVQSGISKPYDHQKKIVNYLIRYEHIKKGKLIDTEFQEFNLRLYEKEEIYILLEESGFVDAQCFKAFTRSAPDRKDAELTFECRRPLGH
ncbi:class I SAM-dependent methyltransferase [candidate division KSB1 bacterium]|nr:class I SAM-dependent methyltransferase [candidate division KSB1 bacterium]